MGKISGPHPCGVAGDCSQMPCLSPLWATQHQNEEITLHPRQESALSSDEDYFELPCGRCPACHMVRVRSWAIRAHHESLMCTRPSNGVPIPNGCFITLTYDPDHLPAGSELDKSDWQKFIKRLRKKHKTKIRYLHCGEYGPNGGRPHLHACLFGIDFHWDRLVWKDGKSPEYISQTLTETWGNGFCSFGAISYATASYTAGYVTKKLSAHNHAYLRGIQDLENPNLTYIPQPEYVTMSLKPGLGADWFEEYWPDVYPADQVVIGGKTYKPPSFYDELLLRRDPALYARVMGERREHISNLGPTTHRALHARIQNFHAHPANQKTRKDL